MYLRPTVIDYFYDIKNNNGVYGMSGLYSFNNMAITEEDYKFTV